MVLVPYSPLIHIQSSEALSINRIQQSYMHRLYLFELVNCFLTQISADHMAGKDEPLKWCQMGWCE